MRSRKRFTRVAVLAAIALVAVTLMAVPGNATFAKKYDLTIGTPSGTTAGAPTTFTATYVNKSLFKIGSTDLLVPPGFAVTSATTTKGNPPVITPPSGPTFPTSVKVTGLTLALGASFKITVSATIACGTPSPAQWTALTKELVSGALFSYNNADAARRSTFTDCPQPISITKYNDSDASGTRNGDPLEGGLGGWEFKIRAGAATTGAALQTTLTGGDGTASFTVPPGTYTVCETAQGGYTNTDPANGSGCKPATVTGTTGDSLMFGNATNATIDVTKYDDTNFDGLPDGEPGLPDWDFKVYLGDSPVGDPIATGTTNADGHVLFSVAPGRAYTVCEVPQDGWTNTDPVNGSGCKPVGADATAPGASADRAFGNTQGVGQLGCPGGPNTDSADGGANAPTANLTRFDNVTGACVLIPYILETGITDDGKQFVDFYKDLETQVAAQFTLEIHWDPEPAAYPVARVTQVDLDGPGPGAAVDLKWCNPPSGGQLWTPPTAVPWCLVSQHSQVGPANGTIQVTEVVYGFGDPRITRG